MALYKRLMVGLDLTAMDEVLLRFMCQFMKFNPRIEDIYFLHVQKDLEKFGADNNGSTDKPIDELLTERMKKEVRDSAAINNINVHFEVHEGDPLKKLLHWADIKHVDLMIAGKKQHEHGKGIVMEKMAQKSKCSILFVPQSYKGSIKKVLIPVDFSENTEHVFRRACSMSKFLPNTTFICQHVVEVPFGHSKVGKSREEMAEIMIEKKKKRWEYFKTHHDLGCMRAEPAFTICEHNNVAKTIFNYAEKEDIDMIVIGSKEQTAVAHFILGSVAEKVISYDHNILLLLVKQHVKEEVYDFFKAMKKI